MICIRGFFARRSRPSSFAVTRPWSALGDWRAVARAVPLRRGLLCAAIAQRRPGQGRDHPQQYEPGGGPAHEHCAGRSSVSPSRPAAGRSRHSARGDTRATRSSRQAGTARPGAEDQPRAAARSQAAGRPEGQHPAAAEVRSPAAGPPGGKGPPASRSAAVGSRLPRRRAPRISDAGTHAAIPVAPDQVRRPQLPLLQEVAERRQRDRAQFSLVL